MAAWSKRERVDAALRGETGDRVPVSAWRHFIPEELSPETLANASLQHFEQFDWNWLKVNPRATYYAEAWGNRYDYSRYDSVLPAWIDGPISSPQELTQIVPVPPTEGVFAEQLELVQRIQAGIGGAHFVQTLFTPLSVLGFLLSRPAVHSVAAAVQGQYDGLRRAIDENPAGVHTALAAIATTLATYAAATIDAGASGIFFAVVRLARQGILSETEYAEFGKPYDLQVLQAVQGAPFNLLHLCGPAAYFDQVASYPVHAINWASVGQHNPTLNEARTRTPLALMGGVDELGALQHGTPAEVLAEARAALQASGERHFLLTPGCGVNLDTPEANLHALRQAVEHSPHA